MTPDPVVKESLTTERDTAYREGFEACREMAVKLVIELSNAEWRQGNRVSGRLADGVVAEIRALLTPTTKG